jgi:excisionase family DNA binding protein
MPKIQSDNRLPAGEPQYYSVAEFAHDVGVHRRTIKNWIDTGKVKAIVVGEVFGIPRSEVRRIKKEMAVEAA